MADALLIRECCFEDQDGREVLVATIQEIPYGLRGLCSRIFTLYEACARDSSRWRRSELIILLNVKAFEACAQLIDERSTPGEFLE